MQASKDAARYLAAELARMDAFAVLTEGPTCHWSRGPPTGAIGRGISTTCREAARTRLAGSGLPDAASLEDVTVMRVVFRNGVSMDLTRLLLTNIGAALQFLDAVPGPIPPVEPATGTFHH